MGSIVSLRLNVKISIAKALTKEMIRPNQIQLASQSYLLAIKKVEILY
jgi:hypothetical protein